MIVAFSILAAALVFLSWKSFTGGIEYLRFFRETLAAPASEFTPPVTVFVPCRGLDQGLHANLSRFVSQDHPDHEVIFIVDSESDPAADVIRELCGDPRVRLVVAGQTEGESQKVHNLRMAVGEARAESTVFVFADSDVRPAANWLRKLTAPLEDDSVGCATGYRWFIAPAVSLASEMRSVWNASIASALGPNTKGNFSWGGSMAIRRETFDRIDMRSRWRGTLSDDFAMTRAMSDNGLPIVFVPAALCASVERCSWRELFEFTTRQMKITRVYAPHLWKLSFIGSFLFTFVMCWAGWLIIFSPPSGFAFAAAAVTVLSVALFSIGKSVWRLRAVELALSEYRSELRWQWPAHCVLWLISPALFLYNSVCALLSRRIVWRGIRYELRSPTETVVLDPIPQ